MTDSIEHTPKHTKIVNGPCCVYVPNWETAVFVRLRIEMLLERQQSALDDKNSTWLLESSEPAISWIQHICQTLQQCPPSCSIGHLCLLDTL